jgi:hypothetical protein
MTSTEHTRDESIDSYAAKAAMAWHGWGSPVGISILLLALGVASVLGRFAVLGF